MGSLPRALRDHWPEYLMEAAELGLFMISAGIFTTLIQSPVSPIHKWIPSELPRRALVGIAMGLTSIALVYSPWGRQSGAHFNPAVTLTFWRLGKINTADFFFYAVGQFVGGIAGVVFLSWLLKGLFRMPPISYVATRPGGKGAWWALIGEIFISFLLMSTVLFVTNKPRFAKYTGFFTGALVALFITFEAPLSGMSMNPARTFASAVPAGFWQELWIYFAGPVLGMLLAVEARKHLFHLPMRACAKLYHDNDKRCIFCGRHIQILALLALCVATLHAQTERTAVGPISITVSNLDRSVEFYTDVLCFKKDREQQGRFRSFDKLTGIANTDVRLANLHLGAEQIRLIQFFTPKGRKYPADSRSDDEWFQHLAIVVQDMDSAYAGLRKSKVREISDGPQTLPKWNKSAGGIKAFYFRDPDGHPLELISFPPGKGDPRWQQHGKRLFLGIDHTAIVVQDTNRSVGFYRALGFHIVGKSLNYGDEQEHLNQVAGSRVRITSLRASDGPGIELLDYLAPRDGRPFPSATLANDLWHEDTTIIAGDLRKARIRLKAKAMEGPLEDLRPLAKAGVKGFTIHDPDGHEMLIRDSSVKTVKQAFSGVKQ